MQSASSTESRTLKEAALSFAIRVMDDPSKAQEILNNEASSIQLDKADYRLLCETAFQVLPSSRLKEWASVVNKLPSLPFGQEKTVNEKLQDDMRHLSLGISIDKECSNNCPTCVIHDPVYYKGDCSDDYAIESLYKISDIVLAHIPDGKKYAAPFLCLSIGDVALWSEDFKERVIKWVNEAFSQGGHINHVPVLLMANEYHSELVFEQNVMHNGNLYERRSENWSQSLHIIDWVDKRLDIDPHVESTRIVIDAQDYPKLEHFIELNRDQLDKIKFYPNCRVFGKESLLFVERLYCDLRKAGHTRNTLLYGPASKGMRHLREIRECMCYKYMLSFYVTKVGISWNHCCSFEPRLPLSEYPNYDAAQDCKNCYWGWL